MRLFISPGNSKMGHVPSLSLLPLETCPKDAPCRTKNNCYSCKLCKLRPALLKTLKDNTQLYKLKPDTYFSKAASYLNYANTRLFRWHAHGDAPDPDYFDRVKKVARKTKHINHLIFTKRFEFPRQIFKRLPSNLTVILSMWNNYGDTDPDGIPRSWYLNPKDPDPRIPDKALLCGGNCEMCGACWNLKSLKRDIILPKH